MTLKETRTKIIEDDAFVLSEVEKLQYLYELKKVIRYDLDRESEEYDTESVAEHVYGMYVLAEYFLPLEDPKGEWDRLRIHGMILWHDIDEIETGDILGYKKTAADRANEFEAMKVVIEKMPESFQKSVRSLMEEYDTRETIESKFVKAIDKSEATLHSFNENGRRIYHKNNTRAQEHRSIKDPYVQDFPFIKKFNEVITEEMVRRQFFAPESE